MKRPSCTGPITYADPEGVRIDIANLNAALPGVKYEEAFISAASPGVVSFFLSNNYYQNHEAYIRAIADAMKTEYEAIVAAGFIFRSTARPRDEPSYPIQGLVASPNSARPSNCISTRSTTRSRTFRRIARGFTCAGVITKARIIMTSP